MYSLSTVFSVSKLQLLQLFRRMLQLSFAMMQKFHLWVNCSFKASKVLVNHITWQDVKLC